MVTGHNRIVGSYMRRASKERSVFIHISDKLKLYLIIDIHRYRVVKKRVFYYCLFKTCFKRFFSFLIRFIRFLTVFFCYKI